MTYTIKPGDLCEFVTDDAGHVVAVRHVAPCDQYAPGTVTDARTGKVVS